MMPSLLVKFTSKYGVKLNYLKKSGTSIRFPHLLLSFCLGLSLLTGCGKAFAASDTYASSKQNNNKGKLSVDLGPDLTVNVGESVYLTAYIKNLGSSTVTYQWVQTSGNPVSLAADNNSYIEFTPLENDILEFEVTITDKNGKQYTDSVIVTVLPAEQSPLSVDLGPDLTVNTGESVYLTASIKNLGSSTVTYQWIQTSGDLIPLAADDNSYIEFTPLVNDVLEFAVTVTDENGQEYTDSVIITVLPAEQVPQYSALLSWTTPTENEDGTSLTNLAGYRIYYGQSVTNLDTLILVNDPLSTTHKINNLDSDLRYFFCVAAYNTAGLESQCSDAVDILIY